MSLQPYFELVDDAPAGNTATGSTTETVESVQRIAEFIFPGEARHQLPLILPVLAHLTNNGDSRWLTCIGPQLLAKMDCRRYRLNWQRLLQVLPNQRCAVIDLAERALQAGKSHTVCVVAETLSAQDLARLERAAIAGDCRGIVIRTR